MTFEKELISRGHVEAAPRLGSSDVGSGMSNGQRILGSVEPWHGNEVVVYTESDGTCGTAESSLMGLQVAMKSLWSTSMVTTGQISLLTTIHV